MPNDGYLEHFQSLAVILCCSEYLYTYFLVYICDYLYGLTLRSGIAGCKQNVNFKFQQMLRTALKGCTQPTLLSIHLSAPFVPSHPQ